MSDIYELTVTVDLRDELDEQELAELRWHLGLGPQPERLCLVTGFPVVVEDDSGNPVIEDEPRPLLAGNGAAWRVGGVLGSALAGRADLPRKGWSLSSRQEIHPDEFLQVGELLRLLAARAKDTHRFADDAVRIGYLRFHEAAEPLPLQVVKGQVGWPVGS
ncbi:hypothetical protein ACFWUZ_19725 [Streptomyces sp. NPDC058646]|uniref:hypothetical protein n=1 Tax=Streptomyces sp. NPDC058646 TaxID=3346574 RepID=UPI0036463658